MNAHAILSAQGWRGHGHSLHKTNDGIGLSKPLLISRKDNTKGLGTAQHFNADQWWLTAFDEQLKGLETSKKGGLKQTVTKGKLNTIEAGTLGKYSVYTSFVSGGFLDGTVDLLKKQWEGSTSGSTSEDDESDKDAKSKDKTKKKEKRTETKEERRARKEAKRNRREKKATRRAEKELRREARRARRERKKTKANGTMTSSSDSSDAANEEKCRRRAKKEEKRRKRKLEETAAKS
ncbi:hypothetical protein ACRE_036900 [Hapsidospora chrysogenum ATCC 11550]|uniref:Uncharacterized protein n=1 Tax=Hapsidospora chrysogenum (strain ATCC 11550 / CBS 779.69 / DSM 880 / IAM 14645 / JCM 23072 / IMI 49137) TaxID=857340 RepID=A0A086T829_HAPC1|nr:hypothetical protein ACRE_036900 [Hapsidospora chrysogenum ATCC 11550]